MTDTFLIHFRELICQRLENCRSAHARAARTPAVTHGNPMMIAGSNRYDARGQVAQCTNTSV